MRDVRTLFLGLHCLISPLLGGQESGYHILMSIIDMGTFAFILIFLVYNWNADSSKGSAFIALFVSR